MKAAFKLVLLTGFVALTFSRPTVAAPRAEDPPAKEPAQKEQPKLDEKPIVVPFELLKSRHMAIEVKINGKGPYRLIFDTGAPTNLINNKIAKDAGVLANDAKGGLPFGAMMGAKTIKTFAVGGVKLEGMPTMVMDHPTVAALAKVLGPVEGLVGYPFFARYKMTIDYQKKEMTLVPNGNEPGDAMKGLMDKLMAASSGGRSQSRSWWRPQPCGASPLIRTRTTRTTA